MKKITLIILAVLAISILTGCSKPMVTETVEYSFETTNEELRDVRIINATNF